LFLDKTVVFVSAVRLRMQIFCSSQSANSIEWLTPVRIMNIGSTCCDVTDDVVSDSSSARNTCQVASCASLVVDTRKLTGTDVRIRHFRSADCPQFRRHMSASWPESFHIQKISEQKSQDSKMWKRRRMESLYNG